MTDDGNIAEDATEKSVQPEEEKIVVADESAQKTEEPKVEDQKDEKPKKRRTKKNESGSIIIQGTQKCLTCGHTHMIGQFVVCQKCGTEL